MLYRSDHHTHEIMTKALAGVTVCIIFVSFCVLAPVRAQSGTETEIVFTEQTDDDTDKQAIDAAKRQLQRILSTYDLDPWILTRDVRIKPGVDPHSRPILTLNTDYLDDDHTQLSIFVHEQAHWLPREKRVAAVNDLQALYPDIPGVPIENENYAGTEDATYHHLIVGWTELDALTELLGEERARQILRAKIKNAVEKPYVAAERSYIWYNNRVLEDTQEIGAILAKHDLVITPDKGLAVQSDEE
jgi:hypothetical protein